MLAALGPTGASLESVVEATGLPADRGALRDGPSGGLGCASWQGSRSPFTEAVGSLTRRARWPTTMAPWLPIPPLPALGIRTGRGVPRPSEGGAWPVHPHRRCLPPRSEPVLRLLRSDGQDRHRPVSTGSRCDASSPTSPPATTQAARRPARLRRFGRSSHDAARREIVPANPAAGVASPKRRRTLPRAVPPASLGALLDAVAGRRPDRPPRPGPAGGPLRHRLAGLGGGVADGGAMSAASTWSGCGARATRSGSSRWPGRRGGRSTSTSPGRGANSPPPMQAMRCGWESRGGPLGARGIRQGRQQPARHLPPRPPALLCDPSPGGWGRPSHRPGTPGTR